MPTRAGRPILVHYLHMPSGVATTAMPALQALQSRVAGAPRLSVNANEAGTEAVVKVAALPEDEIELEALMASAPWSAAIIARRGWDRRSEVRDLVGREGWRGRPEEPGPPDAPGRQAVPKKRATRKKPA